MVGILTFHRGPNYGGYLQAWHLRKAIRSLGHQAELVNYQGHRHHEAESQVFRGIRPGQLKGMVLHYLKCRPFRQPVADLNNGPFLTDPTRIDWRAFETVVVGSDIVWDFRNHYFGTDPTYYGALPCQADTRFVSYAPSCGETSAADGIPNYVRDGLSRFAAIHVRDRNTAAVVKEATGVDPQLVVDPTWLQEDPVVPYPKRPNRPYILLYGQGATPDRSRILGDYCRKSGLDLVAAAFRCDAANHRIFSIGPFEWVDLFRHATAVVTSTFHGLLYSIKYRKPVLFMERGASRLKGRIAIERCGLEDRVVAEDEPFSPTLLAAALAPERPPVFPDTWVNESRLALAESLGTS